MVGSHPESRTAPRHRVLVCNHHLEVRAGSELVTLEVAETLRERGHEVVIFTFHLGEVAVDFTARTGIAVLGPAQRDAIVAFGPEVIHAHHWPTLALLRRLGVNAPVVMGFLGVIPDLENPPPISSETRIPWWAVSEEVHANVNTVPGWSESPSRVLRNWFDDRTGTPDLRQAPVEMRRILAVSNHFPDELLAALEEVGATQGATVTHVGLPENPRRVDDALLKSFDAVVTLGRTAITCLALGVPVLVLDQHGGDGWVTPDNLSALAACNFSGRAMRLVPTTEVLSTWLRTAPDLPALRHLQQWAWAETSLLGAVDQLESLYEVALSQPPGDLGRWSAVAADYASGRSILAGEVQRLLSELTDAREQRDSSTNALGGVQLALAASEQQLATVTEELDRVRSALAAAQGHISSLTAEREDLLGSASWRITAPLRSAKRSAKRATKPSRRNTAHSHEVDISEQYTSSDVSEHSLAARAYFLEVERSMSPFRPLRRQRPDVRYSGDIPRASWVGVLERGRWAFTLGQAVERSEHGFFEGVWDGAFETFAPDGTEFAFGSGAVWRRGRVTLIPPKQPKEALWVIHDRRSDRSVVSNSLAFCLTAAGVSLDSDFFGRITESLHERALADARRGIDRSTTSIIADGDWTLARHSYHNFQVGVGCTVKRDWTEPRAHFDTFAGYRSFLANVVGALNLNGADPRRRHPLAPLTSISRGYDSVAASAIARGAGCTDAVTLATSVYGREDSGKLVGEALGLRVVEHQHLMGPQIDQLNLETTPPELLPLAYEFIATDGVADDVAFLPFEASLAGSVFHHGGYGDYVWPRESGLVSGLPTEHFGRSFSEFRLRLGFASVPVPMLGSRFAPPISAISLAPEMSAYTLHNDYDRPIARRIAEEAGVPREAFGIAKTATAPWMQDHRDHFPQAMRVIAQRYSEWNVSATSSE